MKFTHEEIRDFAAGAANGTIIEQALLATKNLESAVYRRKSMTETEIIACRMLIQCAEEIAAHIAEKPVDNSRSMLPRELREGLNSAVVCAMVQHNPTRYALGAHSTVLDHKTGAIWKFKQDFLVRG